MSANKIKRFENTHPLSSEIITSAGASIGTAAVRNAVNLISDFLSRKIRITPDEIRKLGINKIINHIDYENVYDPDFIRVGITKILNEINIIKKMIRGEQIAVEEEPPLRPYSYYEKTGLDRITGKRHQPDNNRVQPVIYPPDPPVSSSNLSDLERAVSNFDIETGQPECIAGRGIKTNDYKIQSVVIDKKIYSKKNAEQFIKKNKFKNKKVDTTPKYYRFRQLEPKYLKKLKYTEYRMKKIDDGIYLVIAYKK